MVWVMPDVRSCLWVGSFRGDGKPLMLGPAAAAVAAIASKPYAPGCKEFICKQNHTTQDICLLHTLLLLLLILLKVSKFCLHLC